MPAVVDRARTKLSFSSLLVGNLVLVGPPLHSDVVSSRWSCGSPSPSSAQLDQGVSHGHRHGHTAALCASVYVLDRVVAGLCCSQGGTAPGLSGVDLLQASGSTAAETTLVICFSSLRVRGRCRARVKVALRLAEGRWDAPPPSQVGAPPPSQVGATTSRRVMGASSQRSWVPGVVRLRAAPSAAAWPPRSIPEDEPMLSLDCLQERERCPMPWDSLSVPLCEQVGPSGLVGLETDPVPWSVGAAPGR